MVEWAFRTCRQEAVAIPFTRRFGPVLTLSLLAAVLSPAAAQQVASQAVLEERLVAAAVARTRHAVTYDGTYRRLAYPGGDVAADRGVCTDVVIRAYRAGLGIDLQERVHEDMRRAFERYPATWGLGRPDANIDHRRVPNLEVYFARHGRRLTVSRDPRDYKPGDLVTWRLGGGLPHIGVVTDRRSPDGKRPLIAHNMGQGPQLEDMLFDHPIHGHFHYIPEE